MSFLSLNNTEVLSEMLRSKGFIVGVASYDSYLVVTYRHGNGDFEDDYIDYDLDGDKIKLISHSKSFESMMEKRELYYKNKEIGK